MAAFARMRAMLRTIKQQRTGRHPPVASPQSLGLDFLASSVMRRANSTSSRGSDGHGGSRHRLIAAACVERKPVVTADPSFIEHEFSETLQKLELERSLLSDHELRHLEDIRRKERFASGNATESDLETPPHTAQDFEDLATEELHQFRLASRVTEADEQSDQRSLKRQLQRHLLLLVKGNPIAPSYSRSFGDWHLPLAEHQDGETLKQTAERALKEFCGVQLNAAVLGNAPIGFYNCTYPQKHRRDGFIGAKVFFYRGLYVKGSVASEIIDDHCWLTREEVEKLLQENPKYLKALKSFTYDERFACEIKNRFVDNVSTRLVDNINN